MKWVFGVPDAEKVRSQPSIAGGFLYFGTQSGLVYALDAEVGCIRWTYKAKAEVRKRKQEDNDRKTKGIKHISKAIGDQQAKPLTCVFRDRDTSGGGKQGEMTSNPGEVDAIVKGAWQAVYEGVGGCISTAVDKFLETYSNFIIKLPEALRRALRIVSARRT